MDARMIRLASRLVALTGNRGAAAGKADGEIVKAIDRARRVIIQGCQDDQRQLRAGGVAFSLPILTDLSDEELLRVRVQTRAAIVRMGYGARQAQARAAMDAKRGIRPSRSIQTPVRDPHLERLRALQAEHRDQVAAALKEGLGGLVGLLAEEPLAAE